MVPQVAASIRSLPSSSGSRIALHTPQHQTTEVSCATQSCINDMGLLPAHQCQDLMQMSAGW